VAPDSKDEVDHQDKRDLYNGFGDGLALAFEFAVTPAIFGFIGYLIDRGIDTVPLFTILLSLLCVLGMFVRVWYSYDASMQAHEGDAPWKRIPRPASDRERPGRA